MSWPASRPTAARGPPWSTGPTRCGRGPYDEVTMASTCPACGAGRAPDALFCEQCGHDFTGAAPAQAATTASPETQTRQTPGRAQTAVAGEESPLDVGWTGPVARGPVVEVDGAPETCPACAIGHVRGRLLQQLRRQAARPPRPLHRGPRALGGRRVRHRQTAYPQRRRHGAARRPGAVVVRRARRLRRRLQLDRLAHREPGRRPCRARHPGRPAAARHGPARRRHRVDRDAAEQRRPARPGRRRGGHPRRRCCQPALVHLRRRARRRGDGGRRKRR